MSATRASSVSPNKVPKGIGKIIGALIVLLIAFGFVGSMIYTVEAEEEGVILRFGKHIKTVPPGLHFKLPFGIDRAFIVPVKRQLKQEFGFGTAGATNRYQFTNREEQEEEKSMVTGDLNAALVEWVVQYRIDDPKEYLFHVRNPDETLRDASESVMREVVGDRTVDEVITVGRQDIEREALEKLRELVNSEYQMGLYIDQVQLKDVNPPRPVQASFDEVNQAQQEKERAINVANGEYNKEVPRASGEAEQKIQEAEGYATKRVNEAEGDVAAFTALLAEYLEAPAITRRRIYLETLQEVMPKVGRKVILDEESKGLLPLLQLNPDAK